MSLHRFFLESQILSEVVDAEFTLELDSADAKHARVLRLSPGEHIAVIDAGSDYFECEIVAFDGALPRVKITQKRHVAPAFDVCLVQGLAKADKMETVIRHATELGVGAFLPLECKRSVVKLDKKKLPSKLERWRSIAKSAAMQSGQVKIPHVFEPASVADLQVTLLAFDAVLVFWEEAPQTCSLRAALAEASVLPGALDTQCSKNAEGVTCSPKKVAIVVGPEGGLAEDEVRAILAANSHANLVSLGPSILRTETAGIVASALCIYELGGLGSLSGE
jgi:16S rRNA (uracil1498-N3)-methyltransferase